MLESIEIVFENCETVIIPEVFVKACYVGGITEWLTYQKNYNNRGKTASELNLEILKSLDNQGILTTMGEKPVERMIKYQDITHLKLNMLDGKTEQYDIRWYDSGFVYDQSNKNQNLMHTPSSIIIEVRR